VGQGRQCRAACRQIERRTDLVIEAEPDVLRDIVVLHRLTVRAEEGHRHDIHGGVVERVRLETLWLTVHL
jgi:hypothetical protein